MAHPAAKRTEVRRAYVADRQPLRAAAQIAGVGYETARAWKRDAAERGDDWDRVRQAQAVGEAGVGELTRVVLEEFVPLFRSTITAIKSDKLDAIDKAEAICRLSDAYAKTVKASGAVDPAIAKLAWAMDVLKLLAQFTAERFPQHNHALLELLEPFGEHLAETFA